MTIEQQVDALVARGVGAVLGVSDDEFRASLEPLRPKAHELETAANGLDEPRSGRRGVVVIPDVTGVPLERLVPLLTLAGSARPGVLDRNHGSAGLTPYAPIAGLEVPARGPYLVVDVDRGDEFRDVRPEDAVEVVARRNRSPLTIAEGIMLQLTSPDILQRNHCFMLAGSRRGDRRVPALWISNGAPKLGWCWAGNPHSWLGTASAAGRVAA